MSAPDDPAHDAHLRAALRHLPDRDVSPPATVSASILAAARAAVGGSAAAATKSPWQRLRERLAAALRQPATAAAFASLVLATVIGLMWRDGPPREAAPDERTAAPSTLSETSVPAPDTATPRPAIGPAEVATRVEGPAEARAETQVKTAAAERPAAIAAGPSRAAPAPGSKDRPLADAAATAANAVPAISSGAPAAVARPMDSTAAPARRLAGIEDDPLGAVLADRGVSRERSAAPPGRMAGPAEGSGATAARAWLAELHRMTQGRWSVAEAPLAAAVTVPADDGQALGRIVLTQDAAYWQGSTERSDSAAQAPGSASREPNPTSAAAHWWRAPLRPHELDLLRARLADWATPADRSNPP